ncbi:MAG: methyltransferase [uncultured bacterium]|nr:MAG: methyltransferase [uncultured bacterium]
MIKKILKKIIFPIYRLFLRPSIRYSGLFSLFQNILSYSPREKILKISMQFASASKLEGDYLEFGVFEGYTFVSAYHFAQKQRLKSMKFYAFDSFGGLPEIKGIDDEGFQHFDKGQWSCDEDKFKKIISKKRVDLNKTEIVPGWFDKVLNEETKKRLPLKKAAVIWIDCDLYESTVPVLNFITDYVQNGTILIFDDFFCFRGDPNRGEQKALREWLERNPSIKATEFYKFAWHGNSFIIHR